MSLPLDREEVERLCEEIEDVIARHLSWFRQLNAALVFGDALPFSETGQEAYRNSHFGQWYYRKEPHPLTDHADFQGLAKTQQAMHAEAAAVLADTRVGCRPQRQAYNRCIELSLKLNAQLRHLQLEVIGELLATDTLTGAFTRRGMMMKLEAEQERAQRIQRPCSLCLLDFDHFKRVNDQLGHPSGDAVLRQGIHFVLGALRKYDTIFRYGGEEFLICLPGTPIQDARLVIERIREGLSKCPIQLPDGGTHFATASFGLAALECTRPVSTAIHNADMALLEAKQRGRNCVVALAP